MVAYLALLAAAICLPAINGEFIFDDASLYLTRNPVVRDPHGLTTIWLRPGRVDFPLTHSMFWLEWRIAGESPWLYHAINFALHGLATGVLYLLLGRLGIRHAAIVAAWFAVHPLQVETVAWISQRKALLGGLFGFAAAYDYLGFRERGASAAYARSLLWFALSLAGKPTLVMLPVLLFGYELAMTGRDWRRAAARTGAFFLLSALFGAIGVVVQQQCAGDDVRGQDLMARLASLGWAAWFYVIQTVRIWALCFVYPRWRIDGWSPLAWLPNAAAVGVLAAAWLRRGRWGHVPWAAWWAYLVTMLPALGIIDAGYWRYSFVADHYVYQSLPALLTLAAYGLAATVAAAGRWIGGGGWRQDRIVAVAALGLTCVLAAAASWRSTIYRSGEQIWRETSAKNPAAAIATLKVSEYERSAGRQAIGMRLLRQATELDPGLHEAWTQLGEIGRDREEWSAAAAAYEQASRRAPARGLDHRIARTGLAACRVRQGRSSEALALADESIADLGRVIDGPPLDELAGNLARAWVYRIAACRQLRDPDQELRSRRGLEAFLVSHPPSRHDAAIAFEEMQDFTAASRLWHDLLSEDPTDSETLGHAGRLAMQLGNLDEALGMLGRAAARPQDDRAKRARVLCNLGIARASSQDLSGAIRAFEESASLVADDPLLLQNLALAYGLAGREADAVTTFRRILALNPESLSSMRDLAWMLATSPSADEKDLREAARLATRACEISGDERPEPWDALAAAQARLGRFGSAAESCRRAIAIATRRKAPEHFLEALHGRLGLYEKGEAFLQRPR
jgi:tetratricopeptide (TPR) repeat protein